MNEKIMKKYIPMTETAFYILLSLNKERHGYGIITYIKEITENNMEIGSGTIYGTLVKMEKDKLIKSTSQKDRRKNYIQTDFGKEVLLKEIKRIDNNVKLAKQEGY